MHVVWFSWKDIGHPEAGGAELVSDNIRRRLVSDGHRVTLVTSKYRGSLENEMVSGVTTLRAGNKFTVYPRAYGRYKLIKQTLEVDLVIDEMNTIPFFTFMYTPLAKRVLLTYQLARRVWFYQLSFPASFIGYVLEPIYLSFMAKMYSRVLTESNSTKIDLQRYGFRNDSIQVFRVGMKLVPLRKLGQKPPRGKLLFLGAMRPMKRPLDAIKAFECAHSKNPILTLDIAGDNQTNYGRSVMKYIESSAHKAAITVHGRVDDKTRLRLLKQSDIILVTSIKEGWGLIVTEANSQGTPAIVYDSDGLRDSVINQKTGILVDSGDSTKMGNEICDLVQDTKKFERLRQNAYIFSKEFTFENSYRDFCDLLGIKPV